MPFERLDRNAKLEEIRGRFGAVVFSDVSSRPQEPDPPRKSFAWGLKVAAILASCAVLLASLGTGGMYLLDLQATAAALKEGQQRLDEAQRRVDAASPPATAPSGQGQAVPVDYGDGSPSAGEHEAERAAQYRADLEREKASFAALSEAVPVDPEHVAELRLAATAAKGAAKGLESPIAERLVAIKGWLSRPAASTHVRAIEVDRPWRWLSLDQREAALRMEASLRAGLLDYLISWDRPSTLRQFVLRAISVLSPALLMAAAIAFVAAFAIFLLPWARTRAAQLAEAVTRAMSAPLTAGSFLGGRTGASSGSALGLGGFAARAAVATTAVVVTLGAVRVTVPDTMVRLNPIEARASAPVVEMGTTRVIVPPLDIKVDDYQVVDSDDADGATKAVQVVAPTKQVVAPKTTLQLPDVRVTANVDARGAVEAALRKYLETQDLEPPAPGGGSLGGGRHEALWRRLAELEAELDSRPSQQQVAELEARVRELDTEVVVAQDDRGKLRGEHTVNATSRGALASAAACMINRENRGPMTAMFRRGRIAANCRLYGQLKARFGAFVTEACEVPSRWEAFRRHRKNDPTSCIFPEPPPDSEGAEGESSSPLGVLTLVDRVDP